MTMGETHLRSSSNSTVDVPHVPHERPLGLRRTRLPDNHPIQPENGAPSHATGPIRKDSKIGLRAIFTRSRTGKADKDGEEDSSQTASRPTGIRASLADFSHWPSRFHSSLAETASSESLPTDITTFRRPVYSNSRPIQPIVTTSWNPPAFFQVYPQAVKHATLPVCKIPVETLARNSNKLAQGRRFSALEHANDFGTNAKRDLLKQKMSSLKNSRDWTSKIFVLITSGYLLQYAAEGTFDRMPEKVLQLTATSAAYASDLVPGRHWVLQVTSTTDPNGNTFVDPKPRRPRHSAKDSEHVSTMLLIFESAEGMDDWLAILRREIEFHGGKKKQPETGRLEPDDPTPGKQEQSNHKSISAENPDKPTRVITRDFSRPRENTLTDSAENYLATSQPNRLSIYTMDYVSPTASMISSEGQRLDSLRDSGSSHRFSYVSSGQRTMFTSADSSPACSPTRASFSSQGEDLPISPKTTEVRLRPNASAIVNRRESIQALISSFGVPMEHYPSSYIGPENELMNAPSVPNFSVPHAAGKRFSLSKSAFNSSSHFQHTLDSDRSSKIPRKPPPTALLMSRPLSIVIDQPSPLSPRSSKQLSRPIDSCESVSLQSNDAAIGLGISSEQGAYTKTPPFRPSSASGFTTNVYGRVKPSLDLASGTDDRAFEPVPRAASSMGSYSPRRIPVDEWKPFPFDKGHLAKSPYSPKRSVPSLRPSAQNLSPRFLTTAAEERSISTRRSMPHLTEGPPPAPPPNCALPPIPRKYSGAYHSVRL